MAFDPDTYLNELASSRAGVAKEGVPEGIAAPEPIPNAAGLPDYAHDPVPPESTGQVRQAIGSAMARPDWSSMTEDQQRQAVIDAVHTVTRAPPPAPKPPGFLESLTRSAGSAIPGGQAAGAAFDSLPGVGNGRSFTDNFQAQRDRAAAGAAAHPVADVLGRTAGGAATLAASGGLGAPGAVTTAPTFGRLASPLVGNAAAGGAMGAGTAAAEGAPLPEIGKRALAGATTGATVATAIPVTATGIGALAKLFKGAMARSDETILSYVGDASTKKMREKINEKADAAVDMIRDNPTLKDTYKTPADFHQALGSEIDSVGNRTQHIYDEAQAAGGKLDPQDVAKALKASKGQMTFDQAETASAMDPHIQKFADRKPADMSQEAYLTQARDAMKAGKPIAVIKSDLAGNGLSLDEARREVTRLQAIAFDRLDTSIATPARDAAAKAAGILKDAIERHVDQVLPGQAAAVRDLNAQQTVLLRLDAAAKYKAKDAPNAPTTRLGKIGAGVADAASTAAGAGTAALLGAGGHTTPTALAAGAAVAAAPRVVRAAGKAITEGTAALGRAGGDQLASKAAAALSPSPGTQQLTRQLARASTKGDVASALMSHVFGGTSSPTVDDEEPTQFGPAATSSASDEPQQFGGAGGK